MVAAHFAYAPSKGTSRRCFRWVACMLRVCAAQHRGQHSKHVRVSGLTLGVLVCHAGRVQAVMPVPAAVQRGPADAGMRRV